MKKTTFLLVLSLSYLFQGCTSVPLTKEEAAVKIIDPSQIGEMHTCKSLDAVAASGTRINGYRDQDLLIKPLKRITLKVGGNVVVTRFSVTKEKINLGSTDISTQGQAYFCDEEVLKKLHTTENF